MSGPTARMLALLSLLQTRRDWPGALLADRLEVTARTIRRDVDRLRDLGYRVQAIRGPDGGYRLDAGAELPPLLLDDEQAVAVGIALQGMAAAAAGMEDAAARALATMRRVMPDRLRHAVDGVRFAAAPPATAVPADPGVLRMLSAAVAARETVRYDYGAERGAVEPRLIEPQHLVSRAGRWYLVGWDAAHADWRTLRVDRLHPRSHTGARFAPRTVPGGDVIAFVEARFKGSERVNAWPCRGSVTLATDAAAVSPYVDDGAVESLGPGRCRVTLGAWSWVGLAATFGRFDADLADARPAPLAAAFGELSRRFAAGAASV